MHYCNKLTQFPIVSLCTAAHTVTQEVTAAAEDHMEPSQALEDESSQPMLTEGNLTISTESRDSVNFCWWATRVRVKGESISVLRRFLLPMDQNRTPMAR